MLRGLLVVALELLLVLIGVVGSHVEADGVEVEEGVGAEDDGLAFEFPVVGALRELLDRRDQGEHGLEVDAGEEGEDGEALGAGDGGEGVEAVGGLVQVEAVNLGRGDFRVLVEEEFGEDVVVGVFLRDADLLFDLVEHTQVGV